MKLMRLFQVLVILSTVCYIIWYYIPYMPPLFGKEVENMTAYDGYNAILPLHISIYGSLFVLWLLASGGIFFFQNWGRYLYLFLSLISIFLSLLSGVSIFNPIESFLFDASTFMTGLVVAIAFFSPLSEEFGKRSYNNKIVDKSTKESGK